MTHHGVSLTAACLAVGETRDFGSVEGSVHQGSDGLEVDLAIGGLLVVSAVKSEMTLFDILGEVDFVFDFSHGERSFLGTFDDVVVRASEFFAVHRPFSNDDTNFGSIVETHLN